MVERIHKVQKGDSPWKIAQQSLKAQGKKVTNAEIQKEMQRLATLNGCKDINDFGTKYFSSIGKDLKLTGNTNGGKTTPTPTSRAKMTRKVYTTPKAPIDSLPAESTRVAKPKYAPAPVDKLQQDIDKINTMKNDKQKIITHNKKYGTGNYIIVDKKTCRATVYNKAGQALKSYEVLLGSAVGDNMSTAVAANPNEIKNTTVPGEYTFSRQTSEHGITLLMGDSMETMDPSMKVREWAPGSYGKKKFNGISQALHGTAGKNREKLYNDGNLANNRVSMGCVNIPLDDLKEMQQQYGIKVGSKIYILPEDKGNSLKLEKQVDGRVKFVTHYANPQQNAKRIKVQNKIAQGNIQRQLQAKKKAEQQKLLAQQKAEQEKIDNFRWYNPSTWYFS